MIRVVSDQTAAAVTSPPSPIMMMMMMTTSIEKKKKESIWFFYSFLSEINAGKNKKIQWDKEAVVITISYSAVCRVSVPYAIRWEKKECTRRWVERASATAGSIKSKPNNRQHQEEEPRPIDINGPNGRRHTGLSINCEGWKR